MSTAAHRPHRLRFRNVVTGEERTVRFGPEVSALKRERHPTTNHIDLWQQVHVPITDAEEATTND